MSSDERTVEATVRLKNEDMRVNWVSGGRPDLYPPDPSAKGIGSARHCRYWQG